MSMETRAVMKDGESAAHIYTTASVNDQSKHRLSATPTCPLLVHFIIRHHPLWIPSCAEGQENIIC